VKDDHEREQMAELADLVGRMTRRQLDEYCREVDHIAGWRDGRWPEKLRLARLVLGVYNGEQGR
jgi:hypothetical protein